MKKLFICFFLFGLAANATSINHSSEVLNKLMKASKDDFVILNDSTIHRIVAVQDICDSVGYYYATYYGPIVFQSFGTSINKVVLHSDKDWLIVNNKWISTRDSQAKAILYAFIGGLVFFIIFYKYAPPITA